MSILAAPASHVNFDLSADSPEADDHSPTAGPDFIPTAEEEAEATELLNGDDEPDDAYWDARADDALALDVVCSGLAWL